MKILICDDLQEEAMKLLNSSGFTVDTAVFNNGHDVLDYLNTGAVADVCILDIVMPEMNGIDRARELRNKGFTGELVFLTTSKEYGHETYRVKAFEYMLKPPTLQDVQDLLSRLKKARESGGTAGILVKTTGLSRFIMFHEISDVEVISHSIHYRLTDGAGVKERAIFGEVLTKLIIDPCFIQCHRSYIVNMDDVEAVSGREFIMRGGARIPLSKSYPETRKKYLQRIAFGGDGK